ncbi:MAG: isoprenylcysteine carboxylmethyltransferase family protein [Acidimicrobiia bacterium]|nr:isoprenylcysteine carboxylmethyltransferase family protein [Acidimicrobiia bacterium]
MNTGSKWVLGQFLLLVGIGLSVAFFGGDPSPATTIAALALFVLGQGMALAAALKMREYISAHPAPAPGASLLSDGVYGIVRHPMYGGVFFMALAVAVFDRNLVALLLTAALAFLFYGKSTYEESLLEETFLGYSEYQQRVRRRFIPWVL